MNGDIYYVLVHREGYTLRIPQPDWPANSLMICIQKDRYMGRQHNTRKTLIEFDLLNTFTDQRGRVNQSGAFIPVRI